MEWAAVGGEAIHCVSPRKAAIIRNRTVAAEKPLPLEAPSPRYEPELSASPLSHYKSDVLYACKKKNTFFNSRWHLKCLLSPNDAFSKMETSAEWNPSFGNHRRDVRFNISPQKSPSPGKRPPPLPSKKAAGRCRSLVDRGRGALRSA